ncbi:MAG: hypothetical protein HZB15_02505, partial [Actinobacteria bacterium]|nr:hypothetical protein [Actinomycetota bacterium]
IAAAAPAVMVHPGRHASWYGPDDTHRERAIAILDALLGAWGHRGGFSRPSGMKLAKYPYPAYPKAKPAADRLPGEAPFALEALTQGLRRATLDCKPYPIKGWLVYGTNLIQAMPQRAETLKAIEALDLMVVVDIVPAVDDQGNLVVDADGNVVARDPNQEILLSAGDLDEAVNTAVLLGDESSSTDVNGTAFEKIDSFRTGVLDGMSGCQNRLG